MDLPGGMKPDLYNYHVLSAYPDEDNMSKVCNVAISLMGRVSSMVRDTWGSIPGPVILKTQKMVLDAALLNTQHYKVRIKWSSLGNGVAPSLHLGVVAIKKGAFGSPSTKVTNFTYLLGM